MRQPVAKPEPVELPPAFALLRERFAEWLAATGRAHRTQENYRQNLTCFLHWLAQETTVTQMGAVTVAHVQQYQVLVATATDQHGRRLQRSTQHTRLTVVRSFFTWLVRSQQAAHNPAATVELPRLPQRLPTVLTRAEVRRLLAVWNGDQPLTVRNRALLEVLYATAVRRHELLGLTVTDVDLTSATLTIRHGKGNRSRLLPLTDAAVGVLHLYLTQARRHLTNPAAPSPALFLSKSGRPLRTADLRVVVNLSAQRARLGKVVTPHVLRHSCATHLLQAHADIRHIQALLGHARLDTTQRYTRVEVTDLRAVLRRCHPRAGGKS